MTKQICTITQNKQFYETDLSFVNSTFSLQAMLTSELSTNYAAITALFKENHVKGITFILLKKGNMRLQFCTNLLNLQEISKI